jgi:hypothetical protein
VSGFVYRRGRCLEEGEDASWGESSANTIMLKIEDDKVFVQVYRNGFVWLEVQDAVIGQ